jgi:hypothetical protein
MVQTKKTATGNKPAIAITSNKPIKPLIINHLPQTPPATTGKKPAKLEMKNKPNMNYTKPQNSTHILKILKS